MGVPNYCHTNQHSAVFHESKSSSIKYLLKEDHFIDLFTLYCSVNKYDTFCPIFTLCYIFDDN